MAQHTRSTSPSSFSSRSILALFVALSSAVAGVSANGSFLTLERTKTIFAFGDSYSRTGYDPTLSYTPLSQNLSTSSGGGSWVTFLSEDPHAAANALLPNNTFDFAVGGATIHPNVTFLGYPNNSMSNQVDQFERWFIENAAWTESQDEHGGRPDWDSESALFTVWYGINDIEIAFLRNESWPETYANTTFEVLDTQIMRLWNDGARHFLLHLVPPFWTTPLYTESRASDADAQKTVRSNIKQWNDAVRAYGATIKDKYDGASAMVWETETWFEAIQSLSDTYGFTNTTSYCPTYAAQMHVSNADPDINDEECGAPESEYFWLDEAHPTWRVHELLGAAVANSLSPSEGIATSFPTDPPTSTTDDDSDDSTTADDSTVTDDAATDDADVDASGETDDHTDTPYINYDANPVQYRTLANGDTELVSGGYARKKRADDVAPTTTTTTSTRRRPHWKTKTKSDPAATPVVPIDPNTLLGGYITLSSGDTLPAGNVWAKRDVDSSSKKNKKKQGKTRIRTADPQATPNLPIDPNTLLGGYTTLANGDSLPLGQVWAKRDVGSSPSPSPSPSDSASTSPATPTPSLIAPFTNTRRRPSWKTRTRAAADPNATPVVPINPNVGLQYATLANGDTYPIAGAWARHRAKRDGEGKVTELRRVEPTAVSTKKEKKGEERRDGEGRKEGFLKQVKDSVLVPGVVV